MATSMTTNSQGDKAPVGLLLIVGDIISNEQREELSLYLRRGLQHIDHEKYHEINDLFNNLLHEHEFQPGLFESILYFLVTFRFLTQIHRIGKWRIQKMVRLLHFFIYLIFIVYQMS